MFWNQEEFINMRKFTRERELIGYDDVLESAENIRNYTCVRDFTLAVETMQDITTNDPNRQYSAIYESDDGQLW